MEDEGIRNRYTDFQNFFLGYEVYRIPDKNLARFFPLPQATRLPEHLLHLYLSTKFWTLYLPMAYIIVGLGNPGEEYVNTRHNVGRIVLETFAKKNDFSPWDKSGKLNALVSEGKIGKEKVQLVMPETFMNKSGASVSPLIKSAKAAEKLIVVHDDLDLPLGRFKVSFNRGPGGHRGVLSIMKVLKTEAFVRVKVGISPETPSGKLKKPQGEKAVEDFILGKCKPAEESELKKIAKKVSEALEMIISESRDKAMGEFNH